MYKNEFETYHPMVSFTYFLLITVFSCVFMHPVCLALSLMAAFTYFAVTEGKTAVKKSLVMLPFVFWLGLLNPLFNHQGMNIITYLPGGNPLTLESVLYGVAASVMVISVICWFFCMGVVISGDKLIYLFGKITPSISLVLSMTFRLIPKFRKELKRVAEAQKCIGKDLAKGSLLRRAKIGMAVLSSVLTSSLENAIDTADSMKSRGYGTKKRTAFSLYKINKRDLCVMAIIIICGTVVITGGMVGAFKFAYFPGFNWRKMTPISVIYFAVYAILCFIPHLIELVEVIRWKAIKSRL